MFSKIKSLVHEAVEALAPDPPQESFVFHWKAVTNYFIEATDEKLPVFSTNIPYHLEKMLDILRQEEEETSGGATGPCLEYLLQHKILDTLHTLARADCPPGMKQQVLSFFANLMAKMKQPLLPHVNVYRPVHRLIRLCGEVQAAPSENEEVHFLCTVCSKLRQDPYLVNFFLELSSFRTCTCISCGQTHKDSNSKDCKPSDTAPPAYHSSHIPQQSPDNSASEIASNPGSKPSPPEQRRRDKPDYTLVNSLLNLTRSEDSRIAVKACEGLMLCASLPEDHAATVIVLYTPFCEVMADRLKPLFESCPQNMDPADVTTVGAKWGFDHIGDEEDIHMFPGKRQLISFLSWLDYVDQLSNNAHKLVANALAVGVRERFLQPVIEQSFMQQSEIGVISTMAIMRRCLKLITSPHLLKEYSMFLLGENKKPEVESQPSEHKLRQKLMELCDHLSDELSIETLKLFETLLKKPSEVILDNLITRNLVSRKYYNTESATNGTTTVNEPTNKEPPSPVTPTTPMTPTLDEALSLPGGVEFAEREEVERIVNRFLSLVPNEVKSSAQTGDSGYDTYLRDAHQQYNQSLLRSSKFNWPTSPLPFEGEDTRDSFYPGAFLDMLFKKLQRLLDQPYEVNLQVTSVLALLAQFNHPHLHEFLLSPSLPLMPGCKSLHQVLEGVVGDLRGRIERIPNFQRSVVTIRRQLMGLAISPEHKSTAHRNLLEASIVLEEFCKELAAIAFVKATSSLRD